MNYGEFRIAEAVGVMLAHTLRTPTRVLGKGHVLTAQDLDLLRGAGIEFVTGARLQPDDVAENDAAAQIAAMLAGPGTTTRAPYAGRCNVHSAVRGVLQVDAEHIERLNLLDEAIAIATLPPHALARTGQVVATVKIIPCALPRHLLDACREIVASAPPLRMAALRPHRAALILSALAEGNEKHAAATHAATLQRLEALGSRLALVMQCTHQVHAIADLLRQTLAAGCDLVLVAGATMTKDRMDVVPAAVVAAGGEIEHFGMPVEPGNMLLLARIGAVPVIVLPGCARSRRSNGLDWLLHRLLAGLTVRGQDIMRMGVGGLIRNPPGREDGGDDGSDDESEDGTEDGAGTDLHAAPGRGSDQRIRAGMAHVAALVLAAGSSSRMGTGNKLLAEVDGIPMVLRAVNAALASRAGSVTVVAGSDAAAIEALLAGRPVRVVRNADFALGLSTSLRCGIAALPDAAHAVVVMLGDMPRISATHLDRLIEACDAARPAIIVPELGGRRGNPILWPRAMFSAMSALSGDRGARGLLEQHGALVRRIAIDDDAIFVDVDTPADLARVARGGGV